MFNQIKFGIRFTSIHWKLLVFRWIGLHLIDLTGSAEVGIRCRHQGWCTTEGQTWQNQSNQPNAITSNEKTQFSIKSSLALVLHTFIENNWFLICSNWI